MSNQLLPFENIKKIILDLKIEKLLLETFKQIKKSKDITTGDITTEDIVYSLNIINKTQEILNTTVTLEPEDIINFRRYIQTVKEETNNSSIEQWNKDIILKYCDYLFGLDDTKLTENYKIYFPIFKSLKVFNIHDNLITIIINIYTGKYRLIEEIDGGSILKGGAKFSIITFILALILINFTQTHATPTQSTNFKVDTNGRLMSKRNTFPLILNEITNGQIEPVSSISDVLTSLSEPTPGSHPHIHIRPDHKYQVILPESVIFSKQLEPVFSFVLDKFGTFNTIRFLNTATTSLKNLLAFAEFIKGYTTNIYSALPVLKIAAKVIIPNLIGELDKIGNIVAIVNKIDLAVLSNKRVIEHIKQLSDNIVKELSIVLQEEKLDLNQISGGRKLKKNRKSKKQKKFMKPIKKKKSKRIM